MDYLEGLVVRHLYENVTPKDLHPVLRHLANLQAESLKFSDKSLQSIGGFDFQKLMAPLIGEQGPKGLLEQTRAVNPEKLGSLVDKIGAFGMELINIDLAVNTNDYVGITKKVLVHGDMWATNVLYEDKDGKLKAKRVIDYQLVHMGNPAEDFIRLFSSTLSGADRHDHWESLLEKFYKYFLEALENRPAPYTLDQLKESYRLYFVTGGLCIIAMSLNLRLSA